MITTLMWLRFLPIMTICLWQRTGFPWLTILIQTIITSYRGVLPWGKATSQRANVSSISSLITIPITLHTGTSLPRPSIFTTMFRRALRVATSRWLSIPTMPTPLSTKQTDLYCWAIMPKHYIITSDISSYSRIVK